MPMRPRRTPSPAALEAAKERFWAKVDQGSPDECWSWTGARYLMHGRQTYGKFVLDGRPRPAHRVAAAYAHGLKALSPGVEVPPSCGNPVCCNPAHLPMVGKAAARAASIAAARSHRPSSVTRAKLNAEAVRDIRSGRGTKEHVAAMVRKYGIAEVTVRQVIGRMTWKDVA